MKELVLTSEERAFLALALDKQEPSPERSKAFRDYCARHQAVLRQKLESGGQLEMSKDEANYLIFALGGAFVQIEDADEKGQEMYWSILEKVNEAHPDRFAE